MQSFDVKGMTCDHCVRAVTDSIHDVDPAAKVAIDLASGRVVVSEESAPQDVILEAIAHEGYEAIPADS